ncbi:MAG: PAS domain S-box protein [Anaerolineae bacterium]|nr:PAS domain S-box protein [Anaerolineae bacterium]
MAENPQAQAATRPAQWWQRVLPPKAIAQTPASDLDIQTDRERRSRFLRILNRAWLVMGVVALVTLPLYAAGYLLFGLIILITLGTYGTIRWLNRRGNVALGGAIFSVMVDLTFLTIFLSMASDIGAQEALDTQSPPLMMMALAILFAGALVGARAAIVLAFVNSVVLVVLVLAINSAEPRISIHMFGWVLAITVWLYEGTLAGAFARLRTAREQLAVMVVERTASLQQALEQIEVILDHSSDVIVLADSRGNVQKVNPACHALLGQKIDKAIEHLLHVMPEPEDVEHCADALLTVIFEAMPKRIEAKVVLDDGTTVDADLALAPVQMPDHQQAGLLLSMRDITHLKELDRFKSRFVANAAHDLSNPLAALKARLYLLKHSPDQLEHHLAVLEQQTQRIDYLVQDLRTLSEMDRGLIKLGLETFDFAALVATVVETHQPIAHEQGVTLTVETPPIPLLIQADRQQCERIVVNLTANAIRYTPSGGQVTLRARLSGDQLVFAMQDTGMGITPDALPHIFERFYRSDRAKRHDSTGTGLGLSIVKEMIQAHKGTITVASVVDQGSTFTTTLPLQQSD